MSTFWEEISGGSGFLFLKDFFAEPALLLAFITAIGYIALGVSFSKIVTGALKTAIGFRLLQTGVGVLSSIFRPFLEKLAQKIGRPTLILDPYAGGQPAAVAALTEVDLLSSVGYILLLALAINVALVAFRRWTKVTAIFLIGHIMYLQVVLHTWLVYALFRPKPWALVLLVGIITGLYWAVGAQLTVKPFSKVSGGKMFAVGHQQMLGDWLIYKVAPLIGNPKKRVEDIPYPKWLSFVHDRVISPAILMLLFLFLIVGIIGPSAVDSLPLFPGKHWIVKVILASLAFPVGITVIFLGVEFFAKELMASFEGIRRKFLPGTTLTLDSAAIYPYSPEAVIFGFFFGAIGQIVGVLSLLVLDTPILALPGFILLFFGNTTIGVFANHFGGSRATVIICLFSGFLQIVVSAYVAHVVGIGSVYPGWGGSFDIDLIAGAMIKATRVVRGLLS